MFGNPPLARPWEHKTAVSRLANLLSLNLQVLNKGGFSRLLACRGCEFVAQGNASVVRKKMAENVRSANEKTRPSGINPPGRVREFRRSLSQVAGAGFAPATLPNF